MAPPTTSNAPRPPPLPPFIGRAGNLTIFITPTKINPKVPNPVQAPPIRWEAEAEADQSAMYQFLWSALAKAHHVHSSLDSHVAHWFGLNHSKYQRELNHYYHTMQQQEQDRAPNK